MYFEKYQKLIDKTNTVTYMGKVDKIIGLVIESSGPRSNIGDVCNIYSYKGN